MNSSIFTINTDVEDVLRKNTEFKNSIEKNGTNSMKLAAKYAAWMAFRFTEPISNTKGGGVFPIARLQDRIKSDVEHIYFAEGDHGWQFKAFGLIEDVRGRDAANKWYGLWWKPEHEGGQPVIEEKFDPDTGEYSTNATTAADEARRLLVGHRKPNDRKYQDMRIRSRLNVQSQRPMAFVQKRSQQAYVKKRQRRAGLMKAGWRAAAKDLGGRSVNRGSWKIQWPREANIPLREIKRHVMGRAMVAWRGMQGYAKVENFTPYIDPGGNYKDIKAERLAMQAINHNVQARLSALARKVYNRTYHPYWRNRMAA